MNLVTDSILVIFAAMSTLAAIHFGMCFDRRNGRRHLLFVVAALSFSFFALFERALMLAETPAQYGLLARWVHIFVWSGLVFTALFVRAYLGTGRSWLLWSFIVLRSVALVINFASPVSLNYLEITSIAKVLFFEHDAS